MPQPRGPQQLEQLSAQQRVGGAGDSKPCREVGSECFTTLLLRASCCLLHPLRPYYAPPLHPTFKMRRKMRYTKPRSQGNPPPRPIPKINPEGGLVRHDTFASSERTPNGPGILRSTMIPSVDTDSQEHERFFEPFNRGSFVDRERSRDGRNQKLAQASASIAAADFSPLTAPCSPPSLLTKPAAARLTAGPGRVSSARWQTSSFDPAP